MVNLNLFEVIQIVNAQVILDGNYLENKVDAVCGADLLSEVLACYIHPRTLLITSLTNSHVIRTASIVDLVAILFVRGREPSKEVLEMAYESNIPLFKTDYNMFEACGKLYQAGLKGCASR